MEEEEGVVDYEAWGFSFTLFRTARLLWMNSWVGLGGGFERMGDGYRGIGVEGS